MDLWYQKRFEFAIWWARPRERVCRTILLIERLFPETLIDVVGTLQGQAMFLSDEEGQT